MVRCDDWAAQRTLRIQLSTGDVSRGTICRIREAQDSSKSRGIKSMRRQPRPFLCPPEVVASGNEAPE
jgi:hypothetical protein